MLLLPNQLHHTYLVLSFRGRGDVQSCDQGHRTWPEYSHARSSDLRLDLSQTNPKPTLTRTITSPYQACIIIVNKSYVNRTPVCMYCTRSMSICPPIPEIQHFQNLTLKIQGQCHGWSGHSKSQSGCNILWTHIPFIPCQSAIPFLRYDFFKFWPWKSKVKVMGEVDIKSHSMGPTFYRLTSL